ncbi:hypothetical protein [Solibacillus sp. CAU 1738]|uniref:hypothetical protein n=1 Tax=Solibacillus sp. CAU 1738 TaxID=3140363 RepID=UPI00326169AB
MKKWLLLVLLILAGCSEDHSATFVAPPEYDYPFEDSAFLIYDQPKDQAVVEGDNAFFFQAVTTYEQASFLRRNAHYMTIALNGIDADHFDMKLGDRYEIEEKIYYEIILFVYLSYDQLKVMDELDTLTLTFAGKPLLTQKLIPIKLASEHKESGFRADTSIDVLAPGKHTVRISLSNNGEVAVTLEKLLLNFDKANVEADLPIVIKANSYKSQDIHIDLLEELPEDGMNLYGKLNDEREVFIGTFYPVDKNKKYARILHERLN